MDVILQNKIQKSSAVAVGLKIILKLKVSHIEYIFIGESCHVCVLLFCTIH